MDQMPPDPDATMTEKRGHSAERIAALHTDLSSMLAAEPPCRCPETGATMAVAMGGQARCVRCLAPAAPLSALGCHRRHPGQVHQAPADMR